MYSLDKEIDYGKPEMHINLKNNIYFPGETIRGKIFLKSGNFFKKGIIIYEIYGHEKIKENKYDIECNNTTKIYYSSLEYPGLINYSLSKGIQIPFEINLPSYILPSFEFSRYYINDKNDYGYIKNFLQIEIPELKLMKQKFIIFRRPIVKLKTPLCFQAERNEKVLGIFNKGCPILKASYNKNYFYFNEEIPVKITLNNNNSKFNIKNINIKLIRNVVFKLKENQEDKKIKDIIFSDELFNKNINLNENEKKDNKSDIINIEEKIKIEEPEKIFNKHIIDYLTLGLRDKSKLILFLPSFDSSLFKCEYFINITGIYDTIFPVSNLNINMPISVYNNENERMGENNEFNLLNWNYDEDKNEESKNNENNELIDKPGYNKEKINLSKDNSDNINNKIKDEMKTYRNDEEKEWNNITNGQIMPELYTVEENKK